VIAFHYSKIFYSKNWRQFPDCFKKAIFTFQMAFPILLPKYFSDDTCQKITQAGV
jgi:hypothetical protein